MDKSTQKLEKLLAPMANCQEKGRKSAGIEIKLEQPSDYCINRTWTLSARTFVVIIIRWLMTPPSLQQCNYILSGLSNRSFQS
jgi:hypothetical protein